MSPRSRLLPIVLSTMLLAGCLSGDDLQDPDEDGGPEPVSEAGYGTIRGLIVTTDLDPIAGARIHVVEGTSLVADATTDSRGRYAIANLEPGDYRVQVSSICCREHVQGIRVEADKTHDVNVQLVPHTADDLQISRIEPMEWTGFLSCTFRWPTAGVVPYSGISACSLYDPTGQDDFLHNWEIRQGLKSVVGALVWDAPGAALGDELTMYVERAGSPNAHPRYGLFEGKSPLEWRVDEGYMMERYPDNENHHQHDFSNVEGSKDLMFRIFAGGDVNVVYQQKFTMYWDLYYWEPAPEHATAAPDL